MHKMKHDLNLRAVKLLNVAMMTLPFAACWHYYAQQLTDPLGYAGNLAVIALFLTLYVAFARIYEAFLVSVHRISEMIYSQGLATLLSDGMLFVVICLLSRFVVNILPMLAAAATQLLFAMLWSVMVHKWYYRTYPPKKTAIVFTRRYDIERLIYEYGLEKKFKICKTICAKTCVANLTDLDGMDAAFITGVGSHDRNTILKYCVNKGIEVYVLPRVGDIIMSGAKKMHMFHLPILRVSRHNSHPEHIIIKRLFDIVLSALMLLVTSPVLLITAIAIKVTDGGPVLYMQDRLTKDGKVFKIMKFRSMRVDAEKDGVARLSTGEKDPRITPVGRIIRKFRIDELPQLLNILKGSMSIVGPRPERPEIAAQYEKVLPEFSLRLQVKAGLTGYAQVYGKYNTSPYDKLQMDLMYIANPSLLEDLRILFATVKILFLPESTEGIAVGQITAQENETEECGIL